MHKKTADTTQKGQRQHGQRTQLGQRREHVEDRAGRKSTKESFHILAIGTSTAASRSCACAAEVMLRTQLWKMLRREVSGTELSAERSALPASTPRLPTEMASESSAE